MEKSQKSIFSLLYSRETNCVDCKSLQRVNAFIPPFFISQPDSKNNINPRPSVLSFLDTYFQTLLLNCLNLEKIVKVLILILLSTTALFRKVWFAYYRLHLYCPTSDYSRCVIEGGFCNHWGWDCLKLLFIKDGFPKIRGALGVGSIISV